MHEYADRSNAIETLTELLQGEPTARAERLLDASKGTDEQGSVYRPHLVAALILAGRPHTTRLESAEGAVFDKPSSTIRALLNEQASWDAGVTVPVEWTVTAVLKRLFGRPKGSRLSVARSRF